MKLTPILSLFGVCLSACAATHSWPQFRGENCAGMSESAKPPVEFGPGTNLLWKVELAEGLSSPCIWNDRIFLTTFEKGKLETLCLERSDGKILWRKQAPAEKIEEVNPSSSPASATPATDGKSVYVYFGSYGVIAYDFDGAERWSKPLPMPVSLNGSGASPALMDGLVVINRDQEEGKSSLLAIDSGTGRTVWETARPEFGSSYSTPVLWRRGEDKEVVLAGCLRVVGYGLKDGKERWSAGGLEGVSVCPTPVFGDGHLYVASRSFGGANLPSYAQTLSEMDKNNDRKIAREEGKGLLASKQVFNAIDKNKDSSIHEEEWIAYTSVIARGEHGIFALRPPGTGDVTSTHVVWKQKRGVATVPSPLFYRGRVYLVQDGGRVTCYRAKTGEVLYEQERIGADGQYFASPVAADGKIYLASTRGVVTVIEDGDTLKPLARSELGERIPATPAMADNALYVRTAKHVWAFGKRESAR
jgi:outer membrane protein assembly factor BamB